MEKWLLGQIYTYLSRAFHVYVLLMLSVCKVSLSLLITANKAILKT